MLIVPGAGADEESSTGNKHATTHSHRDGFLLTTSHGTWHHQPMPTEETRVTCSAWTLVSPAAGTSSRCSARPPDEAGAEFTHKKGFSLPELPEKNQP